MDSSLTIIKLCFYILSIFVFLGTSVHSSTGIRDMYSLGNSSHTLRNTECTFILGILTIQAHLDLRNFARSSWIKDLPKHVCYIFLYDKLKYISEKENYDGDDGAWPLYCHMWCLFNMRISLGPKVCVCTQLDYFI